MIAMTSVLKLTITGSGKHIQAMIVQDAEGCQKRLVGLFVMT